MTNRTTLEDMRRIRTAVPHRFETASDLPFAFRIGSRRIQGLPAALNPTRRQRAIDTNLVETTFRGSDASSGIEIAVECLEYKDFPVLEWTVYLTNRSDEDTPVVSELLACDLVLPAVDAVLSVTSGDSNSRLGLEATAMSLAFNERLSFHPEGGRSCDGTLPYFRVLCGDCGYNLSVGWPGQWQADFENTGTGLVFQAKQQDTHFLLKPGETVRTPRITIMAFEGNGERGVNLWRRWVFAHILPRVRGGMLRPQTICSFNAGGVEFERTTEENQVAAIDKALQTNGSFDIWWIDAGWYPCRDGSGNPHWWRTGRWMPDSERYPNGLAPVGRHCREHGIQLLVWFEPERALLGSWPQDMPQDYLLKRKIWDENGRETVDENGLLDIGNPEVFAWLVEWIDRLIKESGITVYRQDFNIPPLEWWLQNEAEDRRGIKENLHVQAYLRFWDALASRNPDLWIDSCASGGRRNDLETMRRAVPLHATDYGYGEHPVKQAFQTTWHAWTPYFRSLPLSGDDDEGNYPDVWKRLDYRLATFDNYAFHNAFGPAVCFPVGYDFPQQKLEFIGRCRKLWERAAPYLLKGDFYSLLPVRKRSDDFFAIQFHDEDDGTGIVQIIRNTRCEQDRVLLWPRALDSAATYRFESPEFDRAFTVDGRTLAEEGFTVSLPRRTGEIWFYAPER